MRSQVAVRLGEQVPQIQHLPPDVASLAAAEEAIELADAYLICDGNPLAESQKITLRAALGERRDGSWAASRVADFGPRQGTGKSDKIAARELAGLILFGERLIIHTAHEFPTANECFLRLVAVFEAWDDLRKRVARIRYANGEQGIELLSGQRLKYRARTGGSGRGFAKADLIVYDEAQHLGREHLAASGPSKLANPNSQTWYAGSGGLGTSAVAWAIRRDALGGDAGRLAYTEMTAEKVRLVGGKVESKRPDPADRDAWYRAMPGLGRWVTEETMQAVFEELGAELFARECLCVWDPELGASYGGLVPVDAWDNVCSKTVAPDGVPVMAIDVHPDRTSAAIVAVSGPVIEVVEHREGLGWLVDRCAQIDSKHGSPMWAHDGRSSAPVASLLPDLREKGLVLVEVPAGEVPAACAALYDAVMEPIPPVDEDDPAAPEPEPRIQVRRHEALDAAIAGVTQHNIGDGWVWDRRNSDDDITPLYAATFGRWVAGGNAAPMIH